MTDEIDQLLSRKSWFDRAVRHLVLLADRKGWSPQIKDYTVRLRYRANVIEFDMQPFGKVVIRRFVGGELATTSETYDLDHALLVTKRLMEEMVR